MTYHISNTDKNQSFRILCDNSIVDIIIRTYRGVMYCTILLDDVKLVSSIAVANDVRLLSKANAGKVGCQIYFHDIDGNLPNTDRFDGISCYLVTEAI